MSWRPRGSLKAAAAAAERVACAPRTPPMLLSAVRRAPAVCASMQRPSRPARATCGRPRPTGLGTIGTRRRRCGGAAVCASAANGVR